MSSIIRPSPEIERRLKKLEIGGSGSGSLVTNIGDNTYEWTDEYTYIAYASAINNASSEGIITSQQDATGFSFRAISEAGVPLNWLGYWTSKSLVQSGDPSDYIWTDLSSELPASSVIKYYTESTNLLTNIGDPYNLVAGVPWVLVSGSIPASAFWVASRYIINGTQTPWKIVPVKTKQNDLGLIIHTISGNKPAMNSTQWKTDAIAAISAFTGNAYSTTNEMGFGTVIGITYDDGKLFGTLKKANNGEATWEVTSTFVDGELLISETIVADKIAANAITASKLSISGTDDVRTITGSIAGQEAAQATADGEIIGFFQTTAPTAANTGTGAGNEDPKFGDIWIDITGGAPLDPDTDIRRYQDSNGGSAGNLSWVVTNKSAIGVIYLNSYQATADIVANKATYDAFVLTNASDLSTIQGQIDGSITTWFYNTAPTLSNVPYTTWSTSALKTQHIGDLYYDKSTGYAYRFAYEDIDDDPDAGVIYSWIRITDTDVTSALANAQTAQDTADGKRRVFVVTPTPPYDVGDLWAEGSSGDIKKCATAKATGAAYDVNDWVVASKYTDDTLASSKISTYYKSSTATPNEIPTALAIGDFWSDTGDNFKLYRAASVGANAIAEGEWVTVRDGTIALAQNAATQAGIDVVIAQTAATAAQDELNEISADNIVTPLEKMQAKTLWDAIVSEYAGIQTSASEASVSGTDFYNTYNSLSTYLTTTTNMFSDMHANTSINAVFSTGLESDFNTGASYPVVSFFDSSNPNKFVVAYRDDSNSSYGTIRAGTIAGNNIIYGPEKVFNSATTNNISIAFDPNEADHFIVAYRDDGNSSNGTARAGYISNINATGVVCSVGSEYVFNAATTYDISVAFDPNTANKFVVAYMDGGNSNYGTAIVGSISSNTVIAYGSEYVFNSSGQSQAHSISFDPNTANQFVVAYGDQGNSVFGTVIVGTINGSAITDKVIAYGSEYVFNSANTDNVSVAFDPNTANKFVVAYRDDGGSDYGEAVVGSIDPANSKAVSFGTVATFNSGVIDHVSMSFDPNTANKFIIGYKDVANSNKGAVILGTISNTALSFGSEYVFNSGSTDYVSVAFDPNRAGTFVAVYRDVGNSAYGSSVVGTSTARALWDTNWSGYYGSKQTLLDAIAAKLKTLADTAQEAANDIADNIYVSNTTTIDGGTIAAGTKITAGSNNNVGVLDGADGTYRIYAGHATPASAPFRVAQDGTVTIESASSGSRLVIQDDTIKVYEGSTLRVKLGNLA